MTDTTPHTSEPIPATARAIVVAVSGQGRLLAHLLAAQHHNNFKVVGVIASTQNCGGYTLAKSHQLPVLVAEFPKWGEPVDLELNQRLAQFMATHLPQLTVLAGFLRPFSHLSNPPAINIHPALLPKFGGIGLYGERVHAAVIHSKDKVSGATCHWVTEDYDAGEVIAQSVVPRFDDDTTQSLADRVFKTECSLLVTAVEWALNQVAKHNSTKDGSDDRTHAV